MNDASSLTKNRWRRLAASVGLTASGLLLALTARAYVVEGVTWPSNQPIILNLQLGSPPAPLRDGSTTWNEVAVAAMHEWNHFLSDGMQFQSNETALTPGQNDKVNSVFFSPTILGESFGSDTLAVTLLLPRQGVMTEADVVVNAAKRFDSYRGSRISDDSGPIYDLRRVLLHEFGHVLGLDHTPQNSASIMAPVITDLDAIQDDDITGLVWLYGLPGGLPLILGTGGQTLAVNKPFTYKISVLGGATRYGADGLPGGLSIDPATGNISGTPTQPGVYTVTLHATNNRGSGTATLVLTVVDVPVVTSATAFTAIVGHPFRFQITATNSPAGFDFGSRPYGLTYNGTTGLISGTPTTAGQQTVYYGCRNVAGSTSNFLLVTVQPDDAALALHQLTAAEGIHGNGPLVPGVDGNLYGVNTLDGQGAIFRATLDGQITVLHTFQAPGSTTPNTAIVQAADGSFYGTTQRGGASGGGTFFRVTPEGNFATIHEFTVAEGLYPLLGLVRGAGGSFYGVRYQPDTSSFSLMVFRITPDGTSVPVHNFTDSEGAPSCLIAGVDGNLYGVTGLSFSDQHVFRLTPDGTFTALHGFASYPTDTALGTLVQGVDGNLYGVVTPANGGARTLYRVTGDGQYTLLNTPSSFGTVHPFALSKGTDGAIYACGNYSPLGSPGGYGSEGVFKFANDGTAALIHTFPDAANFPGSASDSLLNAPTLARDGALYAVTTQGTFYKFAPGVLLGHALFFAGEKPLSNNVYYLTLPGGNFFGYYAYLADPKYVYHFDMGYEYVFDAADGKGGVYLYDFQSASFFYTSPGFPFPYLYDFSLNSVVYYYPDPNNPGRYNTNGTRYFYNFATGQVITK